MSSQRTTWYIVLIFFGLALCAAGVSILIFVAELHGLMQALPFAFIGIGLGVLAGGIGGVISARIIKKNPSVGKQIEIEANDERNIAITNKAKSKSFDYTSLLFLAFMIFLSVMQVSPVVILVFVGAFVSRVVVFICLSNKYRKEM